MKHLWFVVAVLAAISFCNHAVAEDVPADDELSEDSKKLPDIKLPEPGKDAPILGLEEPPVPESDPAAMFLEGVIPEEGDEAVYEGDSPEGQGSDEGEEGSNGSEEFDGSAPHSETSH